MTDVEDRLKNMLEATRALELSPQEADLYSRHLHALHENHGFTHQDGSVSTLMATTVNIDGRERLIPTVVDGRIVSPSEAVEAAVAGGIERYPSYASPEEAKSRYDKMHEYMDRDVDVHRSVEEDRSKQSSSSAGPEPGPRPLMDQ